MIVCVESNFVLELAFLRTEHTSCSTLLAMAESGNIKLVLPAFSIGAVNNCRLLERFGDAIGYITGHSKQLPNG